MTKFKAGDKIVIARSSSDQFWYSDMIGAEFTIRDYEDTVDHSFLGKIERYTLVENDYGVVAGIDAELRGSNLDIIICPTQIRAAAEYLEEHNKFINDSVDEIEDKIYSYIREEAKRDTPRRMVGTMGFTLMFSREDDMLEADVLIDPSVSEHVEFVKVKLDSEGNLVAQYPNR